MTVSIMPMKPLLTSRLTAQYFSYDSAQQLAASGTAAESELVSFEERSSSFLSAMKSSYPAEGFMQVNTMEMAM